MDRSSNDGWVDELGIGFGQFINIDRYIMATLLIKRRPIPLWGCRTSTKLIVMTISALETEAKSVLH